MATIKERAEEYSRGFLAIVRGCAENGYIQGATDQHKIDIDKACEWLKNNMSHFWYTKEDEIVSKFRKAMEE